MNAETLSQGRQDGPFGIKIMTGRYCPRMMLPIMPPIAPASVRCETSLLPRGDLEDRHRGALDLGLHAQEPTLSDFRQC